MLTCARRAECIMTLVRVCLVISALTLVTRPCSAHPDFEREGAGFSANNGETFRLVFHYMDGIVMVDPVKLFVYDSSGRIRLETAYFRDVNVCITQDGQLVIFGVNAWNACFHSAWAFDGNEVRRVGTV